MRDCDIDYGVWENVSAFKYLFGLFPLTICYKYFSFNFTILTNINIVNSA